MKSSFQYFNIHKRNRVIPIHINVLPKESYHILSLICGNNNLETKTKKKDKTKVVEGLLKKNMRISEATRKRGNNKAVIGRPDMINP